MILLLSAVCIAYLAAGFAGAAPVPLTNPTSPSEPSYVAYTGRRGTVDILLSCIITLTLCVYTSIHLNVAPKKPIFGIFPRFWVYKCYWVLIAMFAPEFVLYAAYLQWKNARELCRLLRGLGTGKTEPPPTIRSMLAEAKLWIVNSFRKDWTPLLMNTEQPSESQPESKQPNVAQRELVRSDSENGGSEGRHSTSPESDSATKLKSDQPEGARLDLEPPSLEPPHLEHPKTQLQALTLPDTTLPEDTPTAPTPPEVTPTASTPLEATQTPPAITPTASTPPEAVQTPPEVTQMALTPPEAAAVSPDVTHDERWRKVSMVSAFYIVIGGFAYDVSDLTDHFQYIALTPAGFMKLAEARIITPDVLKDDDITDRSKADALGKLLVCVQALWMVVNCIARKASGRPTTLIELNVIVHVFVAVVVYGLWWYKPLAVANPSLLRPQPKSTTQQSDEAEEDSPELRQEAFLASQLLSNREDFYRLVRHEWNDNLQLPPKPADCNHKDFNVSIKPYIPDPQRMEIQGDHFDSKETCAKLIAELKIKSPGLIILPGQQLVLKVQRYIFTNKSTNVPAIFLSSEELRWLDIECSYRRRMQEGDDVFLTVDGFVRGLTTTDPPNYSVQGSVYTGGIQNASLDFNVLENFALMFMTGLLSCFYAGSHASAWSSHFPTYIERWIWRGACIGIAAAVPFIVTLLWITNKLFRVLVRVNNSLNHRWRWQGHEAIRTLLVYPFYFLFGLTCLLYIFSRLFIPLEAFISVRSLPVGAFDAVNWVEYWPHV